MQEVERLNAIVKKLLFKISRYLVLTRQHVDPHIGVNGTNHICLGKSLKRLKVKANKQFVSNYLQDKHKS